MVLQHPRTVGIALSPLVGLKFRMARISPQSPGRRNCPKPVGGIEIIVISAFTITIEEVGIALSPLVGLKFAVA